MKQKKNLLSLCELTPDEIRALITQARLFKKNRLTDEAAFFARKTAVLLFEKPSLRTRITFETAINELGGSAITLKSDEVGMGKRESVEDVARNLERIVHLIVARTFKHSTVEQLAKYSSVPVINALTDLHHPCQALAFAMTLDERCGLEGRKTVSFIGDSNNVCNSIMILCAMLGHDFVVACPKGYEPTASIMATAQEIARKSGVSISVTHDPAAAVKNAAAVYTDVWTSMGQEKEFEKRTRDFAGFIVDRKLLAHAPESVLVSHCLPAHRGEEIESEVLDSPNSVAFDEAENRLHVQKAVIVHLFS
ncbi:MAG: ornithine carbamoyltransferase [Chitinispirillaceae bacterium]|jgi:ornithine carbamoyltransferase|nr:ornithine carbamoyltransferase [Chitinispirillaceae bacterium]